MTRGDVYTRFMELKEHFFPLERKIHRLGDFVQAELPLDAAKEVEIFEDMSLDLLIHARESHDRFLHDLQKVIADTKELLKEKEND